MNDVYPLAQLLDIIEQLPIRYLRNRTEMLLDDVTIVACFPGTHVPCVIDAGARDREGKCIYREHWHCSGEYSCSSGKAETKRKTRTHHCAAQMQVLVYATADPQKCVVRIKEDTPVAHGSRFFAPGENHRNDWRSKAIIAQAAADGITTIGDLLSERYWNGDLVPLPATKAERESLRCRLKQLNAKLAKEKKAAERKRREEEEEEEESDAEDVDEDDEESVDEAEPEQVMQAKDVDGKQYCLVKWRHWPQSSATWELAARVPAHLVRAFRKRPKSSA